MAQRVQREGNAADKGQRGEGEEGEKSKYLAGGGDLPHASHQGQDGEGGGGELRTQPKPQQLHRESSVGEEGEGAGVVNKEEKGRPVCFDPQEPEEMMEQPFFVNLWALSRIMLPIIELCNSMLH